MINLWWKERERWWSGVKIAFLSNFFDWMLKENLGGETTERTRGRRRKLSFIDRGCTHLSLPLELLRTWQREQSREDQKRSPWSFLREEHYRNDDLTTVDTVTHNLTGKVCLIHKLLSPSLLCFFDVKIKTMMCMHSRYKMGEQMQKQVMMDGSFQLWLYLMFALLIWWHQSTGNGLSDPKFDVDNTDNKELNVTQRTLVRGDFFEAFCDYSSIYYVNGIKHDQVFEICMTSGFIFFSKRQQNMRHTPCTCLFTLFTVV